MGLSDWLCVYEFSTILRWVLGKTPQYSLKENIESDKRVIRMQGTRHSLWMLKFDQQGVGC